MTVNLSTSTFDTMEVTDKITDKELHIKTINKWKRTVYSVICISIKKKIARYRKSKKNGILEKIAFLEWRLGFNLFKSGRFEKAIVYLEDSCVGKSLGIISNSDNIKNSEYSKNTENSSKNKTEGSKNKTENLENSESTESVRTFLHPDSKVHLTAARCCANIYHTSNSKEYFQKSYIHYQNTIDKMEAFISILQLPDVLYEFCILLEKFGSFQAAADIHTKILDNFINYKNYFNVLYRSAIVGKHLSSMSEDITQKTDLLSKCIQVLYFLLEALPTAINEVSE